MMKTQFPYFKLKSDKVHALLYKVAMSVALLLLFCPTYSFAQATQIPFQISVDDEIIEDTVLPPESLDNKKTAKPISRLNQVEIEIKSDSLNVKPILNLVTVDSGDSYKAGDTVRFYAFSNYPAFIKQAEVRIFSKADRKFKNKPSFILPIALGNMIEWQMPEADPIALSEDDGYIYVLRVYDAHGRYDETIEQSLKRTDIFAKDKKLASGDRPEFSHDITDDRTSFRNIAVNGSAITIYGSNIPDGYDVKAFGSLIPIDQKNSFVTQRILPAGEQDVEVIIANEKNNKDALMFQRHVNIANSDWFYVGLADLTIGKRNGDNHIEDVRDAEYGNVYAEGRLALYLKGKIKGQYLLTIAGDTAYDELDQLLRGLDGKDPRRLLKRIDPNRYYPVYGDDSTYLQDAPTNGKFYVRIEKNASSVMWGNYKTEITGTEFLRQSRGLYGAQAIYRSDNSTSFGQRRTEANFYGAQPETLPEREQFLGTGGSAYFLKKQDIVEGSETVSVEIRDPLTNRVINRKTLSYGEDYSFNYLQGMLILRSPLSSTTGSNSAIQDGALGGNAVYLLVEYEYEPLASDVDGYVYGGRVSHWLNDYMRFGITAMQETTGLADQTAYGADIELRKSATTFLKGEIARSSGPGFSLNSSTDGGLTSVTTGSNGQQSFDADAYRLQGQLDLADLYQDEEEKGGNGKTDKPKRMNGLIGGYIEQKDKGFSTLYDQLYANRLLWGINTAINLSETIGLNLNYDSYDDDLDQEKREGKGEVAWQFKEGWKLAFGVGYKYLESEPALQSYKSGYNGHRIDTGVRITHKVNEDVEVYGFGQGTVSRSGDIDRNDRLGLGGKWKLSDKWGVEGEASYGTHGIGGLAAISYDKNSDDHYYFGYRLDPDRAYDLDRSDVLVGSDKGVFVGGIRRRVDDFTTAYAENTYDIFGEKNTLAQTYGVTYAPSQLWTFDGGIEMGRVRDNTVDIYGVEQSDFDRFAPSLAINYKNEEKGIMARLRGEARIENSEDTTRDQNTYLISGGVSIKVSDDWRFLSNVDAVLSSSDSSTSSFQNTDYVEGIIGYAYRPVNNNKLNALFRYNYIYDLPGEGQQYSGTGDYLAASQKSHIISADVNYDLNPWLTIGGKYGMRIGKVKYSGDDALGDLQQWQSSSAHLWILRTDFHVIKAWDILLEGRVLTMPSADTTDYGAVTAIYRHFTNNFKAGVGYNFGSFSDDLRDVTLNDQGWFLNLIGKF